MKFLPILIVVVVISFFIPVMPCTAVARYMHPEELMPLVHGELKGALLWVWDTCYEQHSYVTSLSLLALTSLVWYICSSSVKGEFQSACSERVIKVVCYSSISYEMLGNRVQEIGKIAIFIQKV